MAIKAFNSIGGFSVGENAANIILANGEITTSNANLSANLYVSDTANVGNLRTNNLLYANGTPWDIGGIPAGSNTEIQFNNSSEFGASANFTFNSSTNLLTVTGNISATNANLGNLVTANFFSGVFDSTSSNQSNITAVGNLISLNVDGITNLANTVNVTGNIEANANINANANITGANLNTTGLANIGNLEISGTTTGNLIPSSNITFNLGNATNRWKDLYLSGSSILIGDQNISSNGTGISLSNTTFLTDVVVSGNANISLNLLGNTANFIGNVIAPNVTVNLELSGNTANFTGNIRAANVTANSFVFAPAIVQNASTYDTRISLNSAAGIVEVSAGGNTTKFNPSGQVELGGVGQIVSGTFGGSGITLGTSQTDIFQNRGGNVTVQVGTGGTIANTWTFNNNGNTSFPAAGAVNLGNLATANFVTVSSNLNVTNTANVGNLRTDNLLYANGTPWDFITPAGANTEIQFNDGNGNLGASANFTYNDSTQLLSITGNVTANGTITASNFNGNITGNITGNLTIPGSNTGVAFNDDGFANTSTGFTFDKTSNTANLAGTLNVGNSTVNVSISTGNIVATSNITAGNIIGTIAAGSNTITTTGNANVGNLGTTGLIIATGNISGGNINTSGEVVATGNGIFGNISTTGSGGNITGANVISANTLTATVGLSVTGNANVGNLGFGSGQIIGTGNISVGNIITASINASANVNALALISPTLTSNTTTLTLTAAPGNNDVILVPTGAGNVSVSSKKIINLATPTQASDAATKQYVDDVAQGLHTHDSCNAATQTTLATISGGTVTYDNGTSGVGATLTTTGTFTTIDGVTLSNGMRILVKDEATAANNGIYVRTSTTVLTRADDFDTSTEMAGGDFTFVTAGTLYDNTGWVMTDPVTTVGTSPVTWVQFSGAGSFTANTSAGLVLVGTQFNAKVDGNPNPTTAFDGNGNIYVPANAAFTSPNIGAATGTSVIVTGGVTANTLTANLTLSVTGNANVGNLGTAGLIIATGNISGGNINTAGTVTATGNGTFGNISTTGSGGNITGANVISANTLTATVGLNVTGNANVGNLNVTGLSNLGNVGNVTITGGTNGYYLQTNGSGALVWAEVPTGTGIANGNSNVNIPTANGNVNITATGNTTLVVTGTGANVAGNIDITGNLVAGNITTAGSGGNITGANVIAANTLTATGNVNANNFVGNTAQLSSGTLTASKPAVNVAQTWNNASATFTGILENVTDTNSASGSLLMDLQVGGVSKFSVSKIGNVTVGNLSTNELSANSFTVSTLDIGNTSITANTVTTSSITANQTIATYQLSGSTVTGVEFLVKGYDTPGAKYSVATVLAVTDGNISANNVDYTIYGTVRLGTSTGALAVNIDAGNVALQVTPSSSNSTVWTTQIRTI